MRKYRIGGLLTLACLTMACANSITSTSTDACVLYAHNDGHSDKPFPIPYFACKAVTHGSDCMKDVVDSDHDAKVWRVYSETSCDSKAIESGLSEKYLLLGID